MTLATQKRLKVYEFLDTPHEQRTMTACEFRKTLHMGLQAWRATKDEWKLDGRLERKKLKDLQEAQQNLQDGVHGTPKREPKVDPDFDMVAYFKACAPKVAKAIVEGCMNLNANSQKHFLQTLGLLVEKKETKNIDLVISADELARISRENREFLQREGFVSGSGVRQVQTKCEVLPEEVREDTGQPVRDSTVASLESPAPTH